uniref:Carboxylesterase type B domain-containing protein n=1 Tax=Ditylenchus dipsaci TaxID=166011 RepID=A0A915DK19_9BILA
MISIFLLLFVPLFCQSTSGDQQPFVQLPEYGAHGFTYQYQHKNQELTSNIFLGLPYAQPPVRNLRLEKPEPLSENPQRVINNTDLPVGCTQQENMAELSHQMEMSLSHLGRLSISECFDTFYSATKDKNCPVLVWIHGADLCMA